MAKARNTDQGRHFAGVDPAPGSKKVFSSGDSGGKIFNPVQKPKSNITSQNVPVTGGAQPGNSYPGMNVAAAGTSPTVGKTDKRVAGIQKFYGK